MNKKVFIIGSVLFVLAGSGLADKDEYIKPSELPDNIKSYIKNNYDSKIIKAEKDDDEYEVKLKNGWELEFYLDGSLKKAEKDDDYEKYEDYEEREEYEEYKRYKDDEYKRKDEYEKYINSSALPLKIKEYISENYNSEIKEVEKKNYGYEIELRNGFELKFNKEGDLISQKRDSDDYENYNKKERYDDNEEEELIEDDSKKNERNDINGDKKIVNKIISEVEKEKELNEEEKSLLEIILSFILFWR